MIVFIGCGKDKNTTECEAQNMYKGNYFKTCLEYAKSLTDINSIYILSAKYGVLKLTDIIIPYNITLNNCTKEYYNNWKNKVIQQLKSLGFTKTTKITMLCGKNYYKGLLDYFNNVNIPLKNYRGIGYQMSFMKSQLKPKKQNYLF